MTEGSPPDSAAKPAPVPPPKRNRRWLAGLLLALVLLPLVLVSGMYLVLRSPLLESQIWPRLQPIIAEESGFQVDLDRLRIDLLRGMHIEGLEARQIDSRGDCDNLRVTLDSFTVDMRPLALLRSVLNVDRLAVQGLHVHGCMTLDATDADVDEDDPAPFDLEAELNEMLALLDDPDMAIHLHSIELNDFRADIELRMPEDHLRLTWHGQWDLQSAFHWAEDRLSGEVTTRLASHAPIHLHQDGPDEQLAVQLTPQTEGTLGWSLHRTHRDGPWELTLSPLQMQFGLSDVDIHLEDADMKLAMQWPQYDLQVGGDTEEHGRLHLIFAENWPLRVDLLSTSRLPVANMELVGEEPGHLRTTLDHRLTLQASGDIDVLLPTTERLALDLDSTQGFTGFSLIPLDKALAHERIVMNDARLLVQAARMDERLDGQPGQDVLLEIELTVDQLDSPFLIPMVDVYSQSQLRVQQDLRQAEWTGQVLLDELPLVRGSLMMTNHSHQLLLQPDMVFHIPQVLGDYLPDGEDHYTYGDLRMTLAGDAMWKHGEADLLEADFEQLDTWELTATLTSVLTQTARPRDLDEALILDRPLRMNVDVRSSQPANVHHVDLTLHSDAFQYPPLLKPVPFAMAAQTRIENEGTMIRQEGSVRFNNLDFMAWDGYLDDSQAGMAEMKGNMRLHANAEWVDFLEDMEGVADLGAIDINQSFTMFLRHPHSSLMEIDPELEDLQIRIISEGTLAQVDQAKTAPIQMPEIMQLRQAIDWTTSAISGHGDFQIPTLRWPEDEMQLDGMDVHWTMTGDDGFEPVVIDMKGTYAQDRISLPDETVEGFYADWEVTMELTEPLPTQMKMVADARRFEMRFPDADPPEMDLTALTFPMNLQTHTSFDETGETLTIHSATMTLPNNWFEGTLTGEMGLVTDTALFQGTMLIKPHDGMMEDLKASGEVFIPWQLSMPDAEQVSFSAQAQFSELSLNLPDAGMSGMNGQISLSQELEFRPDDRLAFSYLITPEAFQRVDYRRVEPYLDSRQDFSIREMRVDDLTIGPLYATLPIEQNQMRLQHFTLHMLDGDLAGHFYLDMTPGAWRIGLLSRMTGVDIRQMLPDTLAGTEYAPVGARMAVEFDFNQRLLEGRIDMTDISRAQLLQLMDVMDPDQRDPQLSNARSALRVAHPLWVSVDMQQGLMNLSLGLSIFRDPIHVRGLPLSPIIERFGEEALAFPDTLPLE